MNDVSLLGMLKARMHWQHARQDVLSQNVANIDTPDFQPTDLKPLSFDGDGPGGPGGVLRMIETDPRDLQPSTSAMPFAQMPIDGGSLEDELMQVSDNATNFRLVSSLYSAGLGLIRSAAGGS